MILTKRSEVMSEEKSKQEDELFQSSRICQIGIVVKSIDETIEYYEKVFGFGPFRVVQVDYPNATYYGETAGYRGKRAFFNLGPIQIELIELIDGKTIHEDFLKYKGEGIHHIAFEVDDLEKSEENARKAGLKVTQSFRRPDGSGFAYLDSERIGGISFELIQRQRQYTVRR